MRKLIKLIKWGRLDRHLARTGNHDNGTLGGAARNSGRLAISCRALRQAPGKVSASPKNTSALIIEKLNKEINAALADPKMKARLGDLGLSVLSGSPTEFGKPIADETVKWGKVIRAANIRVN